MNQKRLLPDNVQGPVLPVGGHSPVPGDAVLLHLKDNLQK